jgi:hypothetical protein
MGRSSEISCLGSVSMLYFHYMNCTPFYQRPLKKQPNHVILLYIYSNEKVSVCFLYTKRKRNVVSWLDGIPFLWFPLSQSESRISFWPLLISSFSHVAKRWCCLIIPACLCQSAQPLSIFSQRLLNHRPRKSIYESSLSRYHKLERAISSEEGKKAFLWTTTHFT